MNDMKYISTIFFGFVGMWLAIVAYQLIEVRNERHKEYLATRAQVIQIIDTWCVKWNENGKSIVECQDRLRSVVE